VRQQSKGVALNQPKIMSIVHEFRTFISRGNVIDLAVAVIIGQAFTTIVNSIVKDILSPILGIFLGGIDFGDLAITIGKAEIRYGSFIQASINFLIIAFVVFILVTSINKLQETFLGSKDEEGKREDQIQLLTEIRDLLKKES
jgi:large conductance mechanosensitive channel